MARESEGRNPDGTWKPGFAPNPAGENGHKEGWQPYGKRSLYLLNKYSPEQIKAIVTDSKLQKGISTYDMIILTHLAGTLGGDDRRGEREALLDRIEGKPQQNIKQDVDIAATITRIECVIIDPMAIEGKP